MVILSADVEQYVKEWSEQNKTSFNDSVNAILQSVANEAKEALD